MYTYLLLFMIIVLLLIVLNGVKGDYMHPCAIVLEVYLLSTCFLFTEIKKWDAYIDAKTFYIIMVGLSVYITTSLGVSRFFKVRFKLFNKQSVRFTSTGNPADICNPINLLVCVFSVGVVVLTYRDVKSISSAIGVFSSFGQMTGIFRDATVSGTLELGLSKGTHYGNLILAALVYMYLYIITQSIVLGIKNHIRWYLLRVTPILMYVMCAILNGSRNLILQILIAAVMLFFILHNKYYGRNRKYEFQSAVKVFIIGCIILFLFASMRGIVGRTSDLDMWDYIAKYVGASIKLFDMYVTSGSHNTSRLWGQETFVNVWKFIGQRTGNSTLSNLVMNKEWRGVNGFSLGNVYTAFREYYADFGIIGVIILSAVHSFIFSNAYQRINSVQHKVAANKIDFSILMYAYLAQSLFYFSIDDRFFQAYLSYSTLQTVVIMFILIKLLPRVR